MQRPVTIPRRFLQLHCDSSQHKWLTLVIENHCLFVDWARWSLALMLTFSRQAALCRAVLADDEKPQLLPDFKEKLQRAEVAIRDPQIVLGHYFQHLVQQRAFLGMPIGRQKHLGG